MSVATQWLPTVEGNLFGAFEPIRKIATDDSVFILNNGKTVAVPNAGAAASITGGRTSGYPAAATDRTDNDNTYNLLNIEIDPIRVSRFEENNTSYNKLASLIDDATKGLGWWAARYIMTQWFTTDAGVNDYATTGSVTYASQATGSTVSAAKALSYSDIVKLGMMLDKQAIPRDNNRWLVLNASMYNGLFLELKAANQLELASKSAMTGLLDWIHGFNVIMLPEVINVTASNAAARAPGHAGAATDISAGFALHKSCVSMAMGDVMIYEQNDSPEYYGKIVSGDIFAGGKYRRTDKKGVITVYEGQ